MAVQAHPSATDEQLAAISDAIQTWNDVLVRCFDGLITLTEVERRQDADIVVHYVPTAGGWGSTPSRAQAKTKAIASRSQSDSTGSPRSGQP